MKSKAIITVTAGAVAVLLAACGGGGGGGETASTGTGTTTAPPTTTTPPPPTPATLQVAGTAAIGAALDGASVELKCAAGSATATTGADGGYSVTIAAGALPCAVEVKKTLGSGLVSLHSVAESGTLDSANNRTTAHADVTPVTDMIVAQLGAALPEDSFQAFQASAITASRVQSAAAAIVAALKDAGLDLGAIDPLKADLVARTAAGQGDAYDQLLDTLGTKVNGDGLKMVINQIAVAAQAGSSGDLANAMQAVSGGSLAGCPVAVSGKYRTLDVFGTVRTPSFDFQHMRLISEIGETIALTADPTNACVFSGAGSYVGTQTTFKFVIGTNGAGSFHQRSAFSEGTGYVFPVQSHASTELSGNWTMLQVQPSAHVNTFRRVAFDAQQRATSCAYDSIWSCLVTGSPAAVVAGKEGSIVVPLALAGQVSFYGYRAPNRSLVLFGGSNVGAHIGARLEALALPAVGSTVTSWNAPYEIGLSTVNIGDAAPLTYTITAADAATASYTRRNVDTGRIESLHLNQPLAGLRARDGGSANGSSFAQLVQMPLPGLDMTVSVAGLTFDITGATTMIHDIAVVTP